MTWRAVKREIRYQARHWLRTAGIGALVAGGIAASVGFLVALALAGPLIFWLAWNVLDFGPAVGLPELGFWGIVLATLFLGFGWWGKMAIVAIVFLVEPGWFHGATAVHWPEPTFRNFVAIGLLAILAARPHHRAEKRQRSHARRELDG